MSAQLGKGVRVYIGWSPPQRITPRAASCVQGVILVGPFPAGPISAWPREIRRYVSAEVVRVGYTTEPSWLVQYDATDRRRFQICIESLLFPIDGGEPVSVERDEAVPA